MVPSSVKRINHEQLRIHSSVTCLIELVWIRIYAKLSSQYHYRTRQQHATRECRCVPFQSVQ